MTSKTTLPLLIIALLVTYLAFFFGLNGPFTFDDEPNIVKNTLIQVDELSIDSLTSAALSYGAWPFKRPLSTLSLALNHYFSGLDPFAYKLTNLVIHLINGVLLFAVVRLLLQTPNIIRRQSPKPSDFQWIALLVTAAWLLHPINVTSVLYVIQRMASLAALFSLAGMALYLWGRLKMVRGEKGGAILAAAGLFGATPLALMNKETGMLLPAYLFLIEWLLFGFGAESRKARRLVSAFFSLTLVLPALFAVYFFATHPIWLTDGYALRPFSLAERLLTEPRVLWFYLKLLIFPRPSDLSLFHDDIPLSSDWLTPWTTLPAIIGIGALAIGAVLVRQRQPLIAFGILFFLAGHSMESTVFPLEITHEHRNYLPGVGILLIGVSLLMAWHPSSIRFRPGMVIVISLIAFFGAQTALRANAWSDVFNLAVSGVTDHPNSSRWQHQMAHSIWLLHEATDDESAKPELHQQARQHFLRAAELSPYHAPGSLLSTLHIDSAAGIATDTAIVDSLKIRLNRGLISPFTVTSFVSLLECHANQHCLTPVADIEQLLASLLGNPKINPVQRGKLMAAAANYAFNKVSLERALFYTQAALKADPGELQHHLNHAMILGYAGRREETLALLEHVRLHDDHREFEEKTRHIENQLRQLSINQAPTDPR